MGNVLPMFVLFTCLIITGCSGHKQSPQSYAQQADESNEVAVEEAKEAEEEENNLTPAATQPTQTDPIISSTAPGSKPPASTSPTPEPANDKVLLDIPIMKQNPELKYGCEVTSLAMVLKHAGVESDKLKLADELPKDKDPMQKTKSGDITRWGNPEHGFVGDITGKQAGYAVYAGPLEKLMKQYLHNRTLNLTGKPFNDVIAQLKNGKPVILWTTGDFKAPDRWESWKHGDEKINTPLDLHAVVLVGFDKEHLYVNDPLTGQKARKINKASFLESWTDLGKQALSYN